MKPKKVLHKRGRRTVAETHTLPNGQTCFLAYRNLWQIVREGESDISTAIRAGTAGWGISESDLIDCRAEGVAAIGVIVKETGDTYLAPIGRFYSDAARSIQVGKVAVQMQRFLPMSEFARRPGSVKI